MSTAIALLSLLVGVAGASPLATAAIRAIVRRTAARRHRQVWVFRCAIDGQPAPSVMNREFQRWIDVPGTGPVCPRCQHLLGDGYQGRRSR